MQFLTGMNLAKETKKELKFAFMVLAGFAVFTVLAFNVRAKTRSLASHAAQVHSCKTENAAAQIRLSFQGKTPDCRRKNSSQPLPIRWLGFPNR